MTTTILREGVGNMWEHLKEVNAVVGPALLALLIGLVKLWQRQVQYRHESERRAEEARVKAEQSLNAERETRQKELYDQLHLWRNKFQAMESKLELSQRENMWISKNMDALQAQINAQKEEINSREHENADLHAQISDLRRQVHDLTRRLAKYEPHGSA